MQNRVWRLLAGAALGGVLAWPAVVVAQGTGAASVSRPVVQSTVSERQRLNAALARLSRDSKDVYALLDAGQAARALGDFDAAIGFYRRANEAQPGNPRVQAGLGSTLVMNGDPIAAMPYFADAERGGALPWLIASDRGLAYDLVGDNATAQRYYKSALAVTTGEAQDEVRQRLAISEAIAGDKSAAQATLSPLLNKQDKPGWRTRAFTLAITGDTGEAVQVAQTILPPQLATSIAPYLRYMPRLTKAQQAAAANLGKFPRASEIGHDDARIAGYMPVRMAAADTALIPKGAPLDAKGKNAKPARSATKLAAADPDRAAPPEPKPAIERPDEPQGATSGELPPLAAATTSASTLGPGFAPTPASPRTSTAARAAIATNSASSLGPGFDPTPAASQRASSTAGRAATATSLASGLGPGFDPTPSASQRAPAPTVPPAETPASAPVPVLQPASVTAPASPPPVPGPGLLSLSEIFADLGKPETEAMPASGAVDIRNVQRARPQPKLIPASVEDAPSSKLADSKALDAKGKPKTKAELAKEKADAAKEDATKDEKGTPKTKAELAKEKAEAAKAAAAKKPSHPSRMWVQIGVGRDKAAVAFDWRRWVKQAPALFKGQSPSISDMGRTNRILVGPFETQKAANTFVSQAKKAGFDDVLPWTSPAGQVVDPLPVK